MAPAAHAQAARAAQVGGGADTAAVGGGDGAAKGPATKAAKAGAAKAPGVPLPAAAAATAAGAPSAAAVPSEAPKKKKKKKKPRKGGGGGGGAGGNGRGGVEDGSAAGSEDSVVDVVAELADNEGDVDTIDAWKAKAKQRLALLQDLRGEVVRARAEAVSAGQRAREAEEAEALASSGVKRASALLEERERVNGELGGTVNALRAELTAAVEEKKKAEKKMGMVKALGAKAQEAREAKELAEKKADEAGRELAKARAETEEWKRQVDGVKKEAASVEDSLKAVLAKMEEDRLGLLEMMKEQEGEALRTGEKEKKLAAGVGAVCGFTVAVLLRTLKGGQK